MPVSESNAERIRLEISNLDDLQADIAKWRKDGVEGFALENFSQWVSDDGFIVNALISLLMGTEDANSLIDDLRKARDLTWRHAHKWAEYEDEKEYQRRIEG